MRPIEVRGWAGRALSIKVRDLGEPGWPRAVHKSKGGGRAGPGSVDESDPVWNGLVLHNLPNSKRAYPMLDDVANQGFTNFSRIVLCEDIDDSLRGA